MLNRLGCFRLKLTLLFLATFLLLTPGLSRSQNSDSRIKSLSRRYDHVVVPGNKLKALQGVKISLIGIFAVHNGKIADIVFQVDERGPDGDFIYPQGDDADRRDKDDEKFSPAPDSGPLFDANDEIVFMARDAGDRIDDVSLLPDIPQVWELVITDPLTGDQGWFYVTVYDDKDAAQHQLPQRYISYNHETGEVRTVSYQCRFLSDIATNIEYLSIKTWSPGIQKPVELNPADNLLDSLKTRFAITAMGGRFTLLTRTEKDLISKVKAYKNGPVRVLRKTANSLKIVMGFRYPSLTLESSIYPYMFELPLKISIPVKWDYFVSELRMRRSLDFINLMGWDFVCSESLSPIMLNGQDSQEKQTLLQMRDYSWFALEGPEGLIFVRMDLSENTEGKVKRNMYFVDNPLKIDPPEKMPGQNPNVGFNIVGLEKLKSGNYFFTLKICPIAGGRLGSERALLDIDDKPLVVTVLPLQTVKATEPKDQIAP